jgi:hypothetical protein
MKRSSTIILTVFVLAAQLHAGAGGGNDEGYSCRLNILTPQGFRVFLNGQEIASYGWWQTRPFYAGWLLGPGEIQHLKKGTNVTAAYGVVAFDPQTNLPLGQMDCMIEGLKLSDMK